MDYKTGAQAGASTCQRHQPVLIFRLESIAHLISTSLAAMSIAPFLIGVVVIENGTR